MCSKHTRPMYAKDEKRSKSSFHKMAHNEQAPIHSPSASRRRPRRSAASGAPPRDGSGSARGGRPALVALFLNVVDVCPAVSARCVLLTCACGLAWASLFVWILGPAVASSHGAVIDHAMSGLDRQRPESLPIADYGGHQSHGNEGFLLPGWTPLGHHSRFLGREAFPEQFEHWGEDREVVINTVDVGPLVEDGKTLPTTDLVLAILSGDDEVRVFAAPFVICPYHPQRFSGSAAATTLAVG